ncbi:DUF4097 domain-containing protein [Streptomyces bambusae]|uniref:DUF4097 family beta strand repeat-containing protein n=1 Tax=Streptomyces bambusae TaxID=1550616 RepID=UPI001CFC5E7D|nr:DUF4097 family beta strand repeat-containing protein [Streptomyces bambusae]MCB5168479.1 DUF4097 domain-containing protein [Streptomyces bambusae]
MQKFPATAPVSALVDVPAGRIRFIASDRADATVEVRPANAGKSADVAAAEAVAVDFADGVLRIETPEAKNRFVGDSGTVEVTVQLPAGSGVEAKAAAGEFQAVGPLGDVTFDGAQGSITLDEVAAARLTLLDGDISVVRLGGSAEITTQRGAIRIAEAVHGSVVLSTQQGEISVGAARGVSAALFAGTSYGRIHNSLNNTEGTADLAIRATTSFGDITARGL